MVIYIKRLTVTYYLHYVHYFIVFENFKFNFVSFPIKKVRFCSLKKKK